MKHNHDKMSTCCPPKTCCRPLPRDLAKKNLTLTLAKYYKKKYCLLTAGLCFL